MDHGHDLQSAGQGQSAGQRCRSSTPRLSLAQPTAQPTVPDCHPKENITLGWSTHTTEDELDHRRALAIGSILLLNAIHLFLAMWAFRLMRLLLLC